MNILNLNWDLVVEDYKKGLSTIKLAEKYNCCSAAIRNNLIKRGIVLRNNREYRTKWSLNHNYFKNIDTEHKAYWFGFLSADGNIRIRGNQHIVQFASCDKIVIENFLKDIECGMSITMEEKGEKWKPCYKIVITSEEMYKDLERHGCIPNKSLTLKFPKLEDIPEHLIRHYIRGFFDGDGSVYILNKKWIKNPVSNPTTMIKQYLGVSINGTKEFLEELCKYLKFTTVKKENRRPLTNTYYCNTEKIDTILHIYNYMYDGATIFLPRKKKVFDDFYSKKDVQRL